MNEPSVQILGKHTVMSPAVFVYQWSMSMVVILSMCLGMRLV